MFYRNSSTFQWKFYLFPWNCSFFLKSVFYELSYSGLIILIYLPRQRYYIIKVLIISVYLWIHILLRNNKKYSFDWTVMLYLTENSYFAFFECIISVEFAVESFSFSPCIPVIYKNITFKVGVIYKVFAHCKFLVNSKIEENTHCREVFLRWKVQ